MLEQLHNLYGGSTAGDLNKKKADLQTEVDSLRSTCSLAELVLKGRDLELLMIKKQVQEKLSTLGAIDTQTNFLQHSTPHIEFVPGSVDLGILQNADESSSKAEYESEMGDRKTSIDENAAAEDVPGCRLSRGSMGDIGIANKFLPNNFTRSASYVFENTIAGLDAPKRSDSILSDSGTQTMAPKHERYSR